jgi:hypothetical protein
MQQGASLLFAGRGFRALRFSYMTRAIPFAVALFSFVALGLTSRPAHAEPSNANTVPVYVLSIWTDDADDQAEALTQALRTQVRQAAGWSLLQTNQSFETLVIALKCPPKPDPACLQRIGDQLKADHYVWGTMDKKKGSAGEVNADLHLWARSKPDTVAHASYSENLKDPNDALVRAAAADLFGKLTGAGSSTPSLLAGGLQTLPTASAPSQPPDEAPAAAERHFPMRKVFAYSTLVLGAALFVASGVEATTWISDSNRSNDDRKQVPRTVTDVCADQLNPSAQDACNQSRDAVTASTLGWIFAGVGAALVGTGVWLIATDHPPRNASGDVALRAPSGLRLQLLPSFGPRASAVDVRVTF